MKKIKKLTIGKGKDYNTVSVSMLGYDFIKNHYRLVAID